MSKIGEMFLKAAGFRIVEKPPAGLYNRATIGYRVRIKGKDYGSHVLLFGPLDEYTRELATELFKEEALDICLMLVGCHA